MKKKRGLSASFVTGAIALVFLIVGFQIAMFVNRAAVSRAVSRQNASLEQELDGTSGKESLLPEDSSSARSTSSGESSQRSTPAEESSRRTKSESKTSNDASVSTAKVVVTSPAEKSGGQVRKAEIFRFNPNEVSVADLMRLGFSEKQAQSIDNYRQKGGRFRRKSDFAKSYVVSDEMFRRLEPYIDIPKLDLNAADSAAFDQLPGIGGYFAAKMVAYREQLHGYSFKEQLMDIYHFDQEKFDGLKDLIEVGPHSAYPLWTLSEDSLRAHPYIGRSAHSIVLFRSSTPKSDWTIEALSAAGILTEEQAAKLSRCRIQASH